MLRRLRLRVAPSVTLLSTSVGAWVSGTSVRVVCAVVPLLPPVSVARSCSVTVAMPPLAASVGSVMPSSNGNPVSLRTTWPSSSNSTLRTCTSSDTTGCSVIVSPSSTWMPSVSGSMSSDCASKTIVGATPRLSAAW